MQKTRKTSHITNIIQFDADGHIVIPASLTLGIAPGADDNSAKVPSTAWVRSIVTTAGGAYVPTGRTITINGVSFDLSANRSWSINTGVLTATAGAGISVSTVDANVNIVNTGLLTATAGAGISVSTVSQNLNIVNTGLLTATAGAGISVSTVNQNLNIVSTAILTATAGSGISVSVVDQNLNVVNTGLLTATAGSGISISTVNQNLNIVNTGLRTATAGSGISISVVDGNLNIVNTITNNNQLTNGADYATTSFVTTQINSLVAGAPGLLDTLDELAQALGDDPNFATTVTTALSNRLRIDTASQGLTSTQQANGRTNLGLGSLAVLSSVGDAQITDVAWSKVTGAPAFITGNQTITLSGDATGSGATAITVTLANSGVTAGTYTKVTVDAKGRVTAGASLASGDLPTYTGTLTSSQVTTALGYTPYNSSNPAGYISSYTETDTLASVTGRGASTSTTLNLNGRVNIGNSLARPNSLNSDSVAHARIGGADVHLYIASLEVASAYRVAVQAARTSDFASFGLDLQSNGGTLFYGGIEVVRNTGTWGISISGNSATTSQTNFSSLTVNSNAVLHAGNFTSYALRWNSTQAPANGLSNTSIVPNSVTLFDGYGAAVPNYPVGFNQWWVGALTMGDASRGFQIAGGYADNELHFRKGSDGWQAWRRVLTDNNFSSFAVPVRGLSNWNDSTVIDDVIGMLAWKNYGNNHVIFDASQGTAPNGTSVNNTNSQIAWTGTYPTLMGWNGSNTYGVRVDSARVADGLASMNISQFTNNSGYVTGGPYLPTAGGTISGNLTINGVWQTNISTTGGWSRLSFTASNAWGDGITYGVLGAGGGAEPGVMTYNQHATWVSNDSGAGIRMGRSGGTSSGAWYQVATMASNEFMIAMNGSWGNGGLKITSDGVLRYGNTGFRYVWESGTWGINITGTAASETLGTVTGRGASTASQVSFTKTDDHAISVGTIRGRAVGTQSGEFIQLYERVNIGGPNGWGASNTAAPQYGLSVFGGANIGYGNDGGLTVTGIHYSVRNTASGRGNLSFNTSSSVLGNIHVQNGAGPGNDNSNQAAITFQGGTASQAQAGIYVLNNNSYGTSMGFAVTESYATGPQLFMTSTNNGVVNFPRATPTVFGNAVLHAGNYNSYSPTLTGGGASGTWAINITGGAGSANLASNSNALNGLSVSQIFNNMGQIHGTRGGFDASTPSYDFGFRYVQGSGNGPGTGGQYYSWYIGLGSEYPATGPGSYGMYVAINRVATGGGTPYLTVRYNENNSLSGWTRISAGYADTAGSLSNMNISQFTNNSGYLTSESDTLGSVVSRGRSAGVGFTSYTPDGLFSSAAAPVSFGTPHSSATLIGYHDGGGGQYAPAIGFLSTGYYPGLAAIRGRVSGEGNDRFTIYHSGQIAWGPGGSTGLDTFLYRDGSNNLRTDGVFRANDLRTTTGHLRSDNPIYNLTLGGSAQNVWAGRMLISESYYGTNGLIPWGSGINKTTLWVHDYGASRKHGAVISCDNNGEAHLYAVDFANSSGSEAGNSNSGGWGWNMFYDGVTNNAFNMRIGQAGTWTQCLTIDFSRNVTWSNLASFSVNSSIVAGGDITAFSDARVKENVQTVEDALNKVTSLRGVTYTRKDIDDKSTKMGVIAQEVLAVIPEVVQKDNNGNYSVAYGNMVGILIEAIKEQQAQIEDLKNQITELKENK